MTKRVMVAVGLVLVLTLPQISSSFAKYDRPGRITVASIKSDGTLAGGAAPIISPNGRFIAFRTGEALVSSDQNLTTDIYMHDRKTRKTTVVSLADDGSMGIGNDPRATAAGGLFTGSFGGAMTPNGRFVAFGSFATNLVDRDVNGFADVFVRDRKKRRTELISKGFDRLPATGDSGIRVSPVGEEPVPLSISKDGRYVAFESNAFNLVKGDTNGAPDVFVADRRTDKITRVSVSSSGEQGNEGSYCSSMDGGGDRIAFTSHASNFASNDAVGGDVFVRDLRSKKTILVDVASDGTPASPGIYSYSATNCFGQTGTGISGNGRYVTFMSHSSNLVPNDTNFDLTRTSAGQDMFVHDLKTRRTERISITTYGAEKTGYAWPKSSITSSGRYVTFMSDQYLDPRQLSAPSIEAISDACGRRCEPTVGWSHVFVHDRVLGITDIATLDNHGRVNDCFSDESAVSASGRFVAFGACIGKDMAKDTGLEQGARAVLVRDRGDAVGSTVSVSMKDRRAFSTTGIAGARDAIGDVAVGAADRGADLIGARLVRRDMYKDLYAVLDVTRIPGPRGGIGGLPVAGDPSVAYGISFRIGVSTFEARAARVGVTTDSVGTPGFALFRCTGGSRLGCRHIADLRGGYGTTGEQIVLSIPFAHIGAGRGARLADVQAFTGLGAMTTGPLELLDRVTLD